MSLRAEHTEATRRGLLDAARDLFGTNGYAGTSTEEIVRRARVTRGALYHHFRGKRDLFRAVYEEVEAAVAERVAGAALAESDPERQLQAGLRATLESAVDPPTRQIVLVDGPAVLGWPEWRAIGEKYGLAVTRLALEGAMDAGYLRRLPVEPIAHVLMGALTEAGMVVAHADDPAAASDRMADAMNALLDGLKA